MTGIDQPEQKGHGTSTDGANGHDRAPNTVRLKSARAHSYENNGSIQRMVQHFFQQHHWLGEDAFRVILDGRVALSLVQSLPWGNNFHRHPSICLTGEAGGLGGKSCASYLIAKAKPLTSEGERETQPKQAAHHGRTSLSNHSRTALVEIDDASGSPLRGGIPITIRGLRSAQLP